MVQHSKLTLKGNRKVVVDACSVSGGISYDRSYGDEHEINDGKGIEGELRSIKRVDHVELVKKSRKIRSAAAYVFRKHCATTSIGWVTEDDQVPKIVEQLEALRTEADVFNRQAAREGSTARVRIGYTVLDVDFDKADAAREISHTIRAELANVRDALRSLDGSAVRAAMVRVKNLDTLASGMGRFAIQDALSAAKEARSLVSKYLSVQKKAKKNGDDPNDVEKPELDLEAIDSAIGMFVDLDTSVEDAAA